MNDTIYNNIFDAHAHYDDKRFDIDRKEIFNTLQSKGVCGIINNAIDIETTKISIDYAEKYPYIYATAGIHPQSVENNLPANYKEVIASYLKHPKVVAIGEIGLEYHYDIPKNLQIPVVKEQIELAKDFDMPMVFHDREAHLDTINILKKYRPGYSSLFFGKR